MPSHFVVLERLHGHTYRVHCPETGQVCVRHADHLKPARITLHSGSPNADPVSPSVIITTSTTAGSSHPRPGSVMEAASEDAPSPIWEEPRSPAPPMPTRHQNEEDDTGAGAATSTTTTPRSSTGSPTDKGTAGDEEDVFDGPLRRNWRPEELEPALKRIQESMGQFKAPKFKAYPPHRPITRSISHKDDGADEPNPKQTTREKKTRTNNTSKMSRNKTASTSTTSNH